MVHQRGARRTKLARLFVANVKRDMLNDLSLYDADNRLKNLNLLMNAKM